MAEIFKSTHVAQVGAKNKDLSSLIFKAVQVCDVNSKKWSKNLCLFIIKNAWEFSNCLILKVGVLSSLIDFQKTFLVSGVCVLKGYYRAILETDALKLLQVLFR